ncbi:MAG: hypothetical protein GX809_04275 [Clostridiaceae bacterium]|nr:hypothetical protein [Clostridiaceae bacterium]
MKLEKQQLENDLVELHLAIANGNIIIDLLTEQALEEALADKIEKAEEEAAKTPPAPKPSRKKEMIKYGLAGALIGILIAAFIAVFRATSSGRIWSPEEFADQVKLFYIGSVYQLKDKEAGKLGTGLDRLFRRLFYGRREQDPQTDLAYAASVLEGLACEDQASREADSVYTLAVIGSGVDALLDQLIETLNGFDGMEAVKVEPDTAEGVKRLSTADGVVQLVEARETRVKKAVHELELSLSLGRRILGIVGLEIV